MNLRKVNSIHYTLSGQSDLPVLLMSHALGTNLTLWDHQAEALQGSFRILRYDSRGHGRSPADHGPYTISLLASDALALLDELGVTRAHFCGISMGGLVGQFLAIQYSGIRPMKISAGATVLPRLWPTSHEAFTRRA